MGCVSYKDKFVYSGARQYSQDCDSKYLAKPGDLVLATRQQSDNLPILAMPAIIPHDLKGEKIIVGTNLYKVENHSEIDNRFLYYIFKGYDYVNYIRGVKTGTTVQMVSKRNVEEYTFLCPSKEIQNKIIEILSRYDSLIENYQKQIKLLEESAQRLYKEWFIDLRFPGHENTKIVDGVPEGWEKKTLDTFCNVFTGKKNANQGVSNGKYKFFTCGDTPLLINSYIYDGSAIIISGNGSYTGRTTFYEGKFDLYQRTYACTMKDLKNNNLIYGLFEIVRCELTNKISGGTHGAAIPYIVMSDVTKFDFLYEENIMQRFSSIMHNILSKSLSMLNQIRLLTEARDRLLPKLMSGEIEV